MQDHLAKNIALKLILRPLEATRRIIWIDYPSQKILNEIGAVFGYPDLLTDELLESCLKI